MDGLGIQRIRSDIVHSPENGLQGRALGKTIIGVIPPGGHIEIVIHLSMHRMQDVKSIGIAYALILRDSAGIEIPGIGHCESIHHHMNLVHPIEIHITAIGSFVVVDTATVYGVEEYIIAGY
jgi:hypothetical protein